MHGVIFIHMDFIRETIFKTIFYDNLRTKFNQNMIVSLTCILMWWWCDDVILIAVQLWYTRHTPTIRMDTMNFTSTNLLVVCCDLSFDDVWLFSFILLSLLLDILCHIILNHTNLITNWIICQKTSIHFKSSKSVENGNVIYIREIIQ